MGKEEFTIAYVSPGWPLSSFPNGIVSYVQNMLLGLESFDEISPILMAFKCVEKSGTNTEIIDLSNLKIPRTLFRKVEDLFWFKVDISRASQHHKADTIIRAITQSKQKIDILELEESYGIGYRVAQNVKIPVVTRLHGPWFLHAPVLKKDKEKGFKYRVKSEGMTIESADAISSPSLDVLERVREFYHLDLPDAQVIPNPVMPISENRLWSMQNCDGRSLLFVGRFDLHKGGDLVLDAFQIIARINPDIRLLFAGPDHGVVVDGKRLYFNEYLNTYVSESHIRDRISYLGHCDTETIAGLRQQCLINMVCSRYEVFGMVVVEALAMGCPVVAADTGGISEIIEDGYNGLLAESGNAESLAEKVTLMLNDSDAMIKMGQNAVKDCRKRFYSDVVVRQSVDFYKSVLKNFKH